MISSVGRSGGSHLPRRVGRLSSLSVSSSYMFSVCVKSLGNMMARSIWIVFQATGEPRTFHWNVALVDSQQPAIHDVSLES